MYTGYVNNMIKELKVGDHVHEQNEWRFENGQGLSIMIMFNSKYS